MTPREKVKKMMSWFDEIHIDHRKDIAYSFANLTLEEKKYILNNSIDTFIFEFQDATLVYSDGSARTDFYWNEVKNEINKL
jgi:hypothetical protein